MATLDATVVNVAGVSIAEDLGMSSSGLTWILDGYILAFAALLLLAGSLADRFGAKRIYQLGLTLFLAASLICGFAGNGGILIAGRLLQGVGASLFMPSSLSLLVRSFPDEQRRGAALGLWTAIVSVASGLGPALGGVLVDTLGWRSIFLVNIPVGLVGLFMTHRVVAGLPSNDQPLPVLSHVFTVLGLTGLCFTLIEAPTYGWESPTIIAAAVICVASLAMFVLRERRTTSPVIPRAMFRNPTFSAANAVSFLLNFALFASVFILAIFLQNAHGASPIEAGLQLLPIMSMFVLGNLIFARLATRMGPRWPMIVALTVATLGSVALAPISASTPYWLIVTVACAVNLGVGVTVPAMTAALMASAPQENANMASAMLNVNRQVGALVGVATVGLLLGTASSLDLTARLTFVVMAIGYFAALVLTWTLIGPSRSA